MSKVVDKVVDSLTSVDNHKSAGIGRRMKAARDALGLTQEGLAAAVGGSKRGIQENEARNRVPGGEVVARMVDLGINANWLLAEEGPMLLADLMAKPEPPKLNVPALTAILEGLLKAGAPPDKAVAAAFEFYQINIDRGLITAEGIGVARKNAA